MRNSFIFLLALLAVLFGMAIGLSAGRSARPNIAKALPAFPHFSAAALHATSPTETRSPKPQAEGARVVRFASNPQPMPAFLVNDVDGNPVSTAAWKGKVVLLNFWATWCPPCRAEVPTLIDLATRYKDRVQIVGVSVDDGVAALPTLFVINPDGNVVQKHEGLYSRELYETEIRLLLGLPADATIETFEDTGQIFLKNAALATELPDVDFGGLTPDQKKTALRRMNS